MSTTINNNEKSVSSNAMGYFFLYIFIAILVLTAIIFLFKSSLFDKRTADASILKNELYANEDLVFSDNTKAAKKWLWEFGDGAKSTAQNGTYHYQKSGSYIIRLTIDGAMRVQFPVTIKDTVTTKADTALTINGPTSGIVNEEVRLEAVGKGTQFEWSFGETGRVDVKGKTALYTFHTPGKFLVQLRSDKSRPVTHIMYITDPSLDTVLVVPGEGERKIIDDIRARLQAIANGADFNSNYYYLTSRYLCNNEKVTVAIDQDSTKRSTDFYSYCMALTFGGEISVDQAQLTISANSSCATLLNIKQHSAKTVKK
ncbi:MAG: PKD domain-containing protein [Mucilaginibacter sp.]|uniref:PKD domain-containing protein n=1 Tax=Mucilaginibacter sp. TaxID=1882438 RepID=UPI0031ABE24F